MPKPTRKFAEMEDVYDNLFDDMNSGVQYRKTWDDFLRFNRLSGANEPREEHVVSFRSLRDLLFHSHPILHDLREIKRILFHSLFHLFTFFTRGIKLRIEN